jgi:hypothetical protein
MVAVVTHEDSGASMIQHTTRSIILHVVITF